MLNFFKKLRTGIVHPKSITKITREEEQKMEYSNDGRRRPDIDAHWSEANKDVCIQIHSNGDYSTSEIHKAIEASVPVGKLCDLETITRVVKNLFKGKTTKKVAKKKSTTSKVAKKICMAKKPTEFKKDTTYNLDQLAILAKMTKYKGTPELKTMRSRISYYKQKAKK